MDAPARPWPPPVGAYAEERELFRLLQNMLEELLIHKPDDPIQYMINHLKQNNDDAPRICVLGPSASGKTTVAMWLCKHLDAIRVSRETLLFKEILALTKEAKAYKERKQKIPNALWANLIQERLSNVDCIKQGWILEGFPENQEQAWMLQSSGIIPRHVVVLYAPDTVLIERNSGKRLDPFTEEVYHTTFDWPSDPLVQRRLVKPEDLSEQEMSKKLLEYHRNFPGVFQIYQKVLKSINADQPSMDVLSQVLTYVQTRHRSAAPFTPRILFCGPPGSGKSLQAALITQKYNVVNVCCGQLLKEAVAGKTKLGELVKPYIDNGYPGYFSLISPMNPSWNGCLNGGLIPSLGKDTTLHSDQHPHRRSKPVSGRTLETRKKILRSAWTPITGMSRNWRIFMKMPFMSMLTKTLMLSLSL
ncbi:adenylate kinase 8 isoform X3 [Aptenodytes patagonicus]|uniref:adenylate kinase 8 isoform X3 n=1 Tax=Aptenodytes patagonicus TaxID=9234 RepID=UPI003F9FBF3F